jgi:hypothetical protein
LIIIFFKCAAILNSQNKYKLLSLIFEIKIIYHKNDTKIHFIFWYSFWK